MSERYCLLIKDTPNEDFSPLEPDFKVVCYEHLTAEEKSSLYSDIFPNTEAILATGPVDSELIAKALKLKVIVVNGAGYDDIDVAAASALHIPVYNIPDVTARATAELALTLMLNVSRRVCELDRRLRADVAEHQNPAYRSPLFNIGQNPGMTLSGKTLGIIGMGHIGKRLARMAGAMNMDILYTQRHQLSFMEEHGMRYLPLEKLLEYSDIVSIHCPLNEGTRNMFNEKAFLHMKQGSILINTARGEIVDQNQLIRFLNAGKLAGAGLDVFPENSLVDPRLAEMQNVVLTPHIGTNTFETRAQMAQAMVSIVQDVCNDRPCQAGHLVNAESIRK